MRGFNVRKLFLAFMDAMFIFVGTFATNWFFSLTAPQYTQGSRGLIYICVTEIILCFLVQFVVGSYSKTWHYFGLKDYQQYIIVKQMARDLNFNIKVIGCPIVREKSGLAMSSRNTYLSEQDKQNACGIYKSLCLAKKQFSEGKKLKDIKKNIEKNILSIPKSKIDYVELRNSESLNEVTDKDKSIVIAVAVKVGNVRLIDNIVCKK